MKKKLFEHLQACPLVGILRGITPNEAIDVARVLIATGFRFLEVPLNSPDWQKTLKILRTNCSDEILIGAGTVLSCEDVYKVQQAGGQAIISPNLNPSVISKSLELDLLSIPGCYTPTDCFEALRLGADMLKIFPADNLGPNYIKALSAVLPPATKVCPTGGISPQNMADFVHAGATHFGIGSALYKPGMTLEQIIQNAQAFIHAFKAIPLNTQ